MVDCIVLLSPVSRPECLDAWMQGLAAPPRIATGVAGLVEMVGQRRPALLVTSVAIADELRSVPECEDLAVLAWTDVARCEPWADVDRCRADDVIWG
ncbi:MAG: hypothetical protein ACK5JM_13165, partial [Rhodoblastus sp.]